MIKLINNFPTLYEDELFYSAMSRYRVRNGISSTRTIELDLFKKIRSNVGKSVFFPQYINNFINSLPGNTLYTSKEIIWRHTMFPFYTSFLSKDKSDLVILGMEKGSNGNSSIESLVGMLGSKVKPYKYLRYCPLCFEEDLYHLGESYWRRLPQIPGVLYCPKHQIRYQDSTVIRTDIRNVYKTADESTCSKTIKFDDFPTDFKRFNIEYVKNTMKLLQNEKRKEHEFIVNFYIDRLREGGFTSAKGIVKVNELMQAFIEFYSMDYLKVMQSDFTIENETNWMRRFIRNNNMAKSPLRHLLLLQFLNVNIDGLFNETKVFGRINNRVIRQPIYSIEERREEWLKVIDDNPNASRTELIKRYKGLYTWITTYDFEWYDKVTPRKKKITGLEIVDWQKRDEESLLLAKEAVKRLYQKEGKPIRITFNNIRQEVGAKSWFLSKKLKNTHEYLKGIQEDLKSYRIRKIKWAINELKSKDKLVSPYQIQSYVGFPTNDKELRRLIEKVIESEKE